jgi:N-acyl-D-amino-acid deacylase
VTPMKLKMLLAALLGSAAASAAADEHAATPPYDLVIRGGKIVDGTGAPAYRADLGVRGDRIVAIARGGLPEKVARTVLDATNQVVAPGFIDNHAHIAVNVHEYPLAENFLRQGITTIIASLHSGPQPSPMRDYMDALRVAPNVGFFAGHSFARTQVLGQAQRDPNAAELAAMQEIVADAMKDGALGLSTGLIYVPANYAKTEELIALARVASCYGGIYVSHMRDEGRGVLDAIAELIRISEEAGLPAHINHHKVTGAGQWGWSARTLALIDAANARGLDIGHDLYPYTASSSSSAVMFPAWAHAGGPEMFRKRIAEPATRKRIEAEVRRILLEQRGGADLRRLQFRIVPSAPEYNGRTLADLAADRGLQGSPDDAVQLLIELQLAGGFSAIYHAMEEEDVVRILQHPLAMIETDGDPVGWGEGYPHPRSYGAFPRVLGSYVRERNVLTLEDAVRRMTLLPAEQYGQSDRGRLHEGALADITIFDPATISDRAEFTDPHQFPTGIRHVIVNGIPVIRNGSLTGAMPGRVLKGPARAHRVRTDPTTPGCPT